MSGKEIFEEYTAASNKSAYLRGKAKELEIPVSSMIAEMMKATGYKFLELERSMKSEYNPAIRKYEKWKAGEELAEEAKEAKKATEEEKTEESNLQARNNELELYKYELEATIQKLKETISCHEKEKAELEEQVNQLMCIVEEEKEKSESRPDVSATVSDLNGKIVLLETENKMLRALNESVEQDYKKISQEYIIAKKRIRLYEAYLLKQIRDTSEVEG